MASKQLTASVRLNTSQFEQKLRRIAKGIDALNNGVRKNGSAYDAVNRALAKSEAQTKKVKDATNKVRQETNRVKTSITSCVQGMKRFQNISISTKGVLGGIASKLKMIAGTYLGIMGAKATIGISDTITSSQNKLNYVNSQQMGSSAIGKDGGYSNKVIDATQKSMDKMYVSSQKVRMGYADMMSNVSKSMALAGDSFQNSTDNAIRFQEIMAEAYTIGGASAQEMHSSMYQMMQALGAGILAGDELRSVREGAPLAYKAIEEFAQGVYNTEESLKDLASQGKISSDMVVAAIMKSGDKMDKAFNKTKVTFGQVWTQIKNMAIKAFEPVSNQLNKMLNDLVQNGALEKLEQAFMNVSKALQIVLEVGRRVVTWFVQNWNWLKYVIMGVVIAIISAYIVKAGVAVACATVEFIAWAMANAELLLMIIIIFLVISAVLSLLAVFLLWKQGVIDTCQAIFVALLIVGVALVIINMLLMNWFYVFIGIFIILLAVAFKFFEQVCGAATWAAILLKNIAFEVANFFIALAWAVAYGFMTAVEWAVGIFNGACSVMYSLGYNLGESIKAIGTNIGIAFSNAWIWAKNTFWEFIADVLDGVSKLEPVINGIASLLDKKGVNFGSLSSAARSNKSEYKEFVAVNGFEEGWLGDAWSSGYNKWTAPKWDADSSFSEKLNTLDGFEKGWSQDAYDIGANWGAGIKDKINDWGSKFQGDGAGSLLDDIGKKLGLDFGDGKFPSIGDPAYDVSNAYNQPSLDDLAGNVGDIADNTGAIKDSMDLADDDLEFLRKIAEMEWRNEFTTAEIKVEMNNNNTVNGERDLDGIVSYLSDVLREEMTSVAYGVHY